MGLSQLMGLVADIASIAGLVVSAYTLYRVKRLEKAKTEEREFMKTILRTEEVDYALEGVIDVLNTESVKPILGSDAIQNVDRLLHLRGRLRGAMEVIGELYGGDTTKYPIVPTGYYSSGFLLHNIPMARKTLRILCWRNLRIAGYDILEKLVAKANEKCKVEIMFLAHDASTEILKDTMTKIVDPPVSVEAMREQLANQTKFIITFMNTHLRQDRREYFVCKMYHVVPSLHMVQIDGNVFVEFPNAKSDLVDYKGEPVRPYLVLPENSRIGSYICKNYQYVDSISTVVTIPNGVAEKTP